MKTLLVLSACLLMAATLGAQQMTLSELFDGAPHLKPAEIAQLPEDLTAYSLKASPPRIVLKCVVLHHFMTRPFAAYAGGYHFFITPRRFNFWPKGLEQVTLLAGDEIEVSAYFRSNEGCLDLRDAVYRVISRDKPTPEPTLIDGSDLSATEAKCQLVRFTATYRSTFRRVGSGVANWHLRLGEDSEIEVDLNTRRELPAEDFPPGYSVEITGFLIPPTLSPMTILMRSPDDVRLIGPGPAMLRQQRLKLGGAVAACLAGVGLWNVSLRRRVRQQTAALVTANARLQASEVELITNLEREKEVSDLKSNFVSMVSHEFRTPLAVILSSTELLRNHLAKLPEDTRRVQMDNIIQSTQQMSGMIEEVLLLGKVEGGRMVCTRVEMDLGGFAAVLVDEGLSATKQRCPILLTVASEVPDSALADPALLRHIFSNLISNAVKYSPAGSNVDFTLTRHGDNAVCTIRDRGIGIPEQDRSHLFEAFHRASNVGQRTGTGLGLVIVKRCVELHGGTITVDSMEHGGTAVTVTLPLWRGKPAEAE